MNNNNLMVPGQSCPGDPGVAMSPFCATLLTLLSILHSNQAFVIHEGSQSSPASLDSVVDISERDDDNIPFQDVAKQALDNVIPILQQGVQQVVSCNYCQMFIIVL